jgi:hypothetical protein
VARFFQQHQYLAIVDQRSLLQEILQGVQESKKTTPDTVQSKELVLHSNNDKWTKPSMLNFLFYGIQYSTCNSRHPSKTPRRIAKMRIFAPQWILRKAYETEIFHHQSKYGHFFHSYNLVDQQCELFEHAREGNVKGIRELFDFGLATPFDRDDDGWTALHVVSTQK